MCSKELQTWFKAEDLKDCSDPLRSDVCEAFNKNHMLVILV